MEVDWGYKLQSLVNIAATIGAGSGLHSFSVSVASGNYERLKHVHHVFCLAIDLIKTIKMKIKNSILQEAADRLFAIFSFMRDSILVRLRENQSTYSALAQRQAVVVAAQLALPC